ncbi:hypothetical protein [Halorubrum ezzemoulense]|uniref:Carboxypeptidase regulatory-like domain-containing protein n=3 Tax=Halorubrum ezzemoulense TaxID=337243 RepID=A0ABT4Z659_HALEZ|nr:hypothetical protein [Halorubrum ezzemoulense]MDB2226041.1 hypothetical protein [Halorubrum ezzemoulense]MDB2239315.1 hypothetical protein [Halorubrum ezzemoulense]MDB2253300.1 hypothetical protein [Halorubrum ezzemoulense]MDB2293646.1 hypothetical protein [Halorubrum ezzemoulense]
MSPHEPSAGAASESRRRAVVVAISLVLVSLVAVGFAPGVASADDTLEREGSDLVVNVSSVDDPETITVAVTDPADTGITYTADATNAEDGEVRIDVAAPDGGTVNGTDLRNASVTVTVDPAGENVTAVQLANETAVPLHAVALADPAWIGDGEGDNTTDRLYVPLDPDGTAGVSAGTDFDVGLDVDGNGTADVEGTIRGDGTQLVVDRGELVDEAGDSRETLDLRVLSSAGPVSDRAPIDPELRSWEDGLALWHPLFEPGETYAVDASVVGKNANYTDTDAETDRGYLELPAQLRGETEIRVSTADGTELANYTKSNPLTYAGASRVDATVDDGSLRFDRSLAGLAVDGAVVDTGNGSIYAGIGGVVNEAGRLAFDGTDLSGAETLLLSTAAGDMVVTLKANSSSAGTGAGGGLNSILPVLLAFLVPFGVGVLPGAVIGHRSQSDPDPVNTLLIGVISFGLAGIAAVGVLVVFALDLFGTDLVNLVSYAGVILGTVGTAAGHQLLAESEVAAASGPFAAKVTVTDGSDLFRGDVTVHYREPGEQERYDPVTVRGGRGTVQLPGTGTWEMYARHGSAHSDVETVDANEPSVTLTIPVEATLTVVDAVDGEPVTDAAISGNGISGTTDRNGAVTIDPPEDATDAEIEVSHDRYADATERVRFQQNASHTVELERRTGRLRGSATVDDTAAGAVPFRIVPDDEFLSDRFDVETVTTDADGTLDERTLPIGQYRVEVTLTDGNVGYEGTETTVTVNESGTARATVDARFTWRLDADRRDRIDRVRSDVRSVLEGGGRDGTIPRYYASVVDSMLEAAESVPDAGHEFVGREVDPSEAVDEILGAAERTTDAISEAMTTKRNVDLFAACADMPDADVRWSGSFELAELLDRLESDSSARRREVKQRYEAVDGLIKDRRGELSEIAPAREMQQRAWELTREADRGPEAVAIGYTSLLLLDAVEELFEHDALRERLTRTVF